MAFQALKARQAEVWGSGPWERVAETAADIHDDLVSRLGVRPGERWLDVATGTGAVALRAARRGAVVTGQDLAPRLVETARRLAAAEGLQVRFEVGDCQALPYSDASFDVVSSAHGAIFAPDHRAVARELARVCRPGGRLGLSSWRPGGAIADLLSLMASFAPPPPEGAGVPLDWGRREYVEELLGGAFELEFFEGDAPQRGESPEALRIPDRLSAFQDLGEYDNPSPLPSIRVATEPSRSPDWLADADMACLAGGVAEP